ncbi:hypothetical protein LCH33_002154 [Pseudomonas amygdali]|uniref:hypothetical protein n=1 Tax=Pseudomonas amygdali TaxID=47877 RepID=UPI000A9FB57F|nr:hypothetical protein [Pseudomonas amygdali]UBT78790.1 hypothetical protein LCH33_002154 [Pseudomonas amygdali]
MNNFYARWAMNTWFGLLYQYRFCPIWDAALNRLIDKHWKSVVVGEHTANLGGVDIWISNRYYAFGHEFASFQSARRPSVWTMRRLDSLVRHVQERQLAEMEASRIKKMEGY